MSKDVKAINRTNAAPAPLHDVRVLDLADLKGELCGRLLGDLGADVLRVEPPTGSVSRGLPPFSPDGTSLYFAYRNTNKRGIVLDFDNPDDRRTFRSLVMKADVVIESETPGKLQELDLGPEALINLNSDLIVASLTNFGQNGPDSRLEATDDTLVARSGWLATSGIPEKPPLLVPGALAYDTLGVLGAYGVLLALLHRDRGAQGQHIDISALEALTQMNTWAIPNSHYTIRMGGEPQQVRSGDSPLYPNIPCEDGMIRQVILSPRQWRALWEWLGKPEEFGDERWEDTFTRLTNLDVLNPIFWEHWAHKNKIEGCKEAQNRGIVCLPLLTPAEVLDNEHFRSRGTFVKAEVATGVVGPVMAGMAELDGKRCGSRHRAPDLGEHEAEFLSQDSYTSRKQYEIPDLPLAGIRVLDFGHGGVGVECGRMLAEYGADVIKVESRSYPDFIRIVLGGEMTAAFASSNRSKRGFGANLKHPEGLKIVKKLLSEADVVIENNSTGKMKTLGLSYETLKELNPELIMVSSQLMGSRGPFASWSGYGPTIQSVTGFSWLWNFDDGDPPPGSPAIHPDHLAGRVCALFTAAALYSRDRNGKGMHVEVAQSESLIATLGDQFLAEGVESGSIRPMGNDSDLGAPWGTFPCAGHEEWCVICVRDDEDWKHLISAMGTPEFLSEQRFAHSAGRIKYREEVNQLVRKWTKRCSRDAVVQACREFGVPAAAVVSAAEQFKDPQLQSRNFFQEIEQPPLGPLILDGPCLTGTAMHELFLQPAPGLGEHTRDICINDLGMDPLEVETLIAKGALEVD